MVDAGAEVDSEGTFGNVVGVQGLLGSEENSLVFNDSEIISVTPKGKNGRLWQDPC